ncbi:MAG: hypothetical protein J1E57_00595 [Prevotella sp.]|nr:hypothetical protein [Prevotella sp.]
MFHKILVITATLGNRESIAKTIASVKCIGKDDVKHIIVCPEKCIATIKEKYDNIECLAERTDKHGIYAALNHGFETYGHDYEYMTFINDDDYWLPSYRKLIDTMLADNTLDMVYARTCYVDDQFVKIGEQTSSPQLRQFTTLLKEKIILLTQQATLIKSSLYFRIGGFDESYKLIADTKFWALVSLLSDIRFKYINVVCAAYMIQQGQLSSDHTTQSIEHERLLSEIRYSQKSSFWHVVRFRFYNLPIYIKRLFMRKHSIFNPFVGGVRAVKKLLSLIIKVLIIFLPWRIKRFILQHCYGYELDKRAHIGFSYVYPKKLVMGPGATIGHLNVIIRLDLVNMDKNTTITQQNWVTAFPMENKNYFKECPDRKTYLIMDEGAAITKKHHVDCTDMVMVGKFTSIGGYGTQILTHSTSLKYNRQMCAPIKIGRNCFIGTRSILLTGTALPDCCVLGAGAVLQKSYTETYCLYGGVPAKFIKKLDDEYSFLTRTYRPGQKIVD